MELIVSYVPPAETSRAASGRNGRELLDHRSPIRGAGRQDHRAQLPGALPRTVARVAQSSSVGTGFRRRALRAAAISPVTASTNGREPASGRRATFGQVEIAMSRKSSDRAIQSAGCKMRASLNVAKGSRSAVPSFRSGMCKPACVRSTHTGPRASGSSLTGGRQLRWPTEIWNDFVVSGLMAVGAVHRPDPVYSWRRWRRHLDCIDLMALPCGIATIPNPLPTRHRIHHSA